ncbi:DUF1573 domain-containing protein [Ferruginibacter sp. HRS2-29]|uniref:DUF1573 domain-containing protein n=1 Tax=Ferruginibacter sp. HRS2-29 TaxID=2487334 RepID=UPI0020CCA327|nr:DUF1573 domain-containing protein [Ferruginibacter sp. HRS2-29]MCP9752781.1 DUF1573 domain-containing protein [Ferruginibacter sp. HRS2-29]
MKKLFALAGFCLLTSSALFAQTAPSDVTKIAVTTPVEALSVNKTEFDFGKIPQGKPVTTEFEVTNTGKPPYKLDNVQASCGCTTPQWDKDAVIAPGATAKITVGYNAAAEGPFTKNITITYNGTQSKLLMIKGEVWKTPATSAPTNESLKDLN